jgi:two-component system heavy metal sensor histidine kinase CusS
MMKTKWSLAFQLTTWYTGASLLLLVVATGILYWALVTNLERDSTLFVADKVHVMTTLLRERPNDWGGLREEIELETAARSYDQFYIRLADMQMKTLLETPQMDEILPADGFAQVDQRVAKIKSRQGALFLATEVTAPVGTSQPKHWKIQIGVSLVQQQKVLMSYREWLWVILSASFILCPLVGYQIARRGTVPLRDVGDTARRIGSSTLSERIEPEGYPIELADLAMTFNAMLDRLQESFERLTRFSADLAHELRTPVNNIRGEIEVALARPRSADEYHEVLNSNLEEVVRLSELIASLLFLARTESPGAYLKRETVNLEQLLHTVKDYYDGPADQAGVALTVDSAPGLSAVLDGSLMKRAIGNLVSNALAHTPSNGSVSLSAARIGNGLEITVLDSGCGVPPQFIERLFDRFYRLDPARSQQSGGFGLGLSIVRGIMILHGGHVRIASEVGRGTQVILTIPENVLT